jgi:hypothetical protein
MEYPLMLVADDTVEAHHCQLRSLHYQTCRYLQTESPWIQTFDTLQDRQLVAISAAKRHTVALTNSGELFTWGHRQVAPRRVNLPGEDEPLLSRIHWLHRSTCQRLHRSTCQNLLITVFNQFADPHASVFPSTAGPKCMAKMSIQNGTMLEDMC